MLLTDEFFMKEALKEASFAFDKGEIPVGAVVVSQNKIIARTHNQTEQLKDVTAHAEILAITAAANFLGAKYLKECTLYVTLEPCVMCAGALSWSQLGKMVIGASDEKRGYARINPPIIHPKTKVITGVLEEECKGLMKDFFKQLRK